MERRQSLGDSAPIEPCIDKILSSPQVRTRHECSAGSSPADLWGAARRLSLSDTPRLSRMLRWRIPGTPEGISYGELFATRPFVILDEGELHSVSGICGSIWARRHAFGELRDASDFRDWSEPGTVRVLFAHWIEPHSGGASIVSEARVEPVDRAASWRLRLLWSTVGQLEFLIGSEALRAAARLSEGG